MSTAPDLPAPPLFTNGSSPADQDAHLVEPLLAAARRFADASRTMATAGMSMAESALAVNAADAAGHHAHNDLLEARLLDWEHGDGQPMGFTAETIPTPEVPPPAAALSAEWAKLAMGRAEVAAKTAELTAEQAQAELEVAEANLLGVARAIPVDGDHPGPHLHVADLPASG